VVADTGTDIPVELRTLVFEPFFATKGAGSTFTAYLPTTPDAAGPAVERVDGPAPV